MKLSGFYQDGSVIASGAFGVVYIIPFEDQVAAILENVGSRKYLAKERLEKLVNTDKTLAFSKDFELQDLEVIANESVLNSRYSIQGGWSLTTGAADGTYTPYTKAFTMDYIKTPEMLADTTQQSVLIGVLAQAVQLKRQQNQPLTGLRKLWNEFTGW